MMKHHIAKIQCLGQSVKYSIELISTKVYKYRIH
jgi:hypothetical protein